MTSTLGSAFKRPNIFKNIFLTALIAGTLDATAAIVVYNTGVTNMFKFIASGAFGREAAFSGGTEMVVAGVIFHYFIALFWTTLFFVSFPFVRRFASRKFLAGIFYGILVWLVMNLIVLPFTKIPQAGFYLDRAVIGATILVLMIGLPVSLLANRFYSRS